MMARLRMFSKVSKRQLRDDNSAPASPGSDPCKENMQGFDPSEGSTASLTSKSSPIIVMSMVDISAGRKPTLTPVEFHILLALAEEARHGYGIKLDVERRTDGRISLGSGTLYVAIQRLEKEGLVMGSRL